MNGWQQKKMILTLFMFQMLLLLKILQIENIFWGGADFNNMTIMNYNIKCFEQDFGKLIY